MPKYDTVDPDWRVIKLVRVGHYLWYLRRQKGCTVSEQRDIDAALETVWTSKRKLKAEIELDRKAKAERTRQYFNRVKNA